jgi:hypothetical protein
MKDRFEAINLAATRSDAVNEGAVKMKWPNHKGPAIFLLE